MSWKSKVLVVDDDKGLGTLVVRSLRREGFAAENVTTGSAAVERLCRQEVDLLLLDLQLPDMSGTKVLETLADAGRAVPFVIITGQGDERVAVEMMKQGAVDYLVKDREFLEFVPTVVRRAVTQIQGERKLAAAEEALKREHAFVKTLLNNTGALVVVRDLEGRFVRFNPAAEKITGYTFEEVKGRSVWELFLSPEEAPRMKAVFRALCDGAPPVREYENRWLTKSGERRRIAWSSAVLPGVDGKPEYILSTGLDVTEHKRLEREVLQISEMERRRLGQDLHDGLCQQLAGIEFMSQVLEQKLLSRSKAAAASAGEIARLVRQAVAQTRDLVKGLSPVPLEDEGLMASLQEMADRTQKLFGIRCRFVCRAPILFRDNTVATQLFRIAQEAVNNAIKHGKAGEIEICLCTTPETLRLRVTNDGEPFPDPMPELAGLGLRIMSYRAGMIGGSLSIRQGPEGGTEVRCSLTPPGAGGAHRGAENRAQRRRLGTASS